MILSSREANVYILQTDVQLNARLTRRFLLQKRIYIRVGKSYFAKEIANVGRVNKNSRKRHLYISYITVISIIYIAFRIRANIEIWSTIGVIAFNSL